VALVRGLGADVVGVQFLIELAFLGGRAKLEGERIGTVLSYDT
jgi:adenine/guanine phosphoribosyltransferase-like PRPP-binding protein